MNVNFCIAYDGGAEINFLATRSIDATCHREKLMTEELKKALDSLKGYKMSQAELDAQRLSFVFGNAPSKGNDTKESVKKAVDLAQMS